MSGEEHFARLVPRDPSSAELVRAATAQAHQISLGMQAHKAHAARLGGVETAVAELKDSVDQFAADQRIERSRADHALKRLGVWLTLAGVVLAPAITAVANYVTRTPTPAAIVAPPSAFDREIEACNRIADAAARGKCVVDVAVANAR